jgi:hypothetical protein
MFVGNRSSCALCAGACNMCPLWLNKLQCTRLFTPPCLCLRLTAVLLTNECSCCGHAVEPVTCSHISCYQTSVRHVLSYLGQGYLKRLPDTLCLCLGCQCSAGSPQPHIHTSQDRATQETCPACNVPASMISMHFYGEPEGLKIKVTYEMSCRVAELQLASALL